MNQELLRHLAEITPEEAMLLKGQPLEQSRYTTGERFVVDHMRMLETGKLITIRPHTRFAPFPAHSHNYVEMMYVCSGQTVHTIDGDTPLCVRAGELLILSQQASHAIQKAGAQDVAVNFIVLPAFFDVALEMVGADNVLGQFLLGVLRRNTPSLRYLHFKVADVLPIQNLMENLVWSLLHRLPNRRRINQTTMGLLFLQLLNYTDHLSPSPAPSQPHALAVAALRDIEENYRTASLSALAAARGVSGAYISQVVREATGKNYKQLLQQKRLAKAAQLLRESRLPIGDIIGMAGYSNTGFFYRLFRRQYGRSPRQYRADHPGG